MFNYTITNKCPETRARAGHFETRHGVVKTPVFMPVGTLGTVKALSPEDLVTCGAQIILGNTYHLYLRPGCEVIEQFSGLHRFMGWERPILTDSGGFQIFSLAKLTQIDDEGAAFQSHIDGSRHLLSPEGAVDIQACLGSDIMMCLDQCIPYPAEKPAASDALDRTTQWANRCRNQWQAQHKGENNLFGIVQGGMFSDLRRRSVEQLVSIGFPGYAVGGLSVGEPKDLMLEMADVTLSALPDDTPRYVMGVGTPEDIVELVALGADMFDCVLPTRNARNGQFFIRTGTINICNAKYRYDADPVDEHCACYTCRNFSRAYLRHLYMAKELLAYRLNTLHNVFFYLNLAQQIRDSLSDGRFSAFRSEFYRHRDSGNLREN